MTVTAKSQYRYFESLDKTIKVAASVYFVLLLCGAAITAHGFDTLLTEIRAEKIRLPILIGCGVLIVYFLLVAAMSRVDWMSKIHGWLDGHFFRLMDRSNTILFDSLVTALNGDERKQALHLHPQQKKALASTVFTGLSKDNTIFTHLLRMGIFRIWIWYWIAMYGTFVFTLLTLAAFWTVLRGAGEHTRLFFFINWILALVHLALGILLGYRLVRMMGTVSNLLVRAHGDQIAAMLKESLVEEDS